MTEQAASHFSLFGLPEQFAVSLSDLEQAWKTVSARVHPDRYSTASAAEKRVAMQWSSRINEAYQVLKNPLARARYLCERAGADIGAENNTAMAPQFLMAQMEWHEALDELRDQPDAERVREFLHTLEQAETDLYAQLHTLLDVRKDIPAATAKVREGMFISKIHQDAKALLRQPK
ncbi:Fe-S protein assembly co-chaperone HscB [Advenella kashmirensis]|uniref:Fe-S protein assembly co-chaperone HscB n=1 Tax=Advenella kashmirensis TaxID=310575 RepID=UPI0002F6ED61|nr:Fe-S protein assembly co-chaperone HscB [Advenella kashmirensis]